MTTKKAKNLCEKCSSQNLKARITTYPIELEGRQLNVERVSVKECLDCRAIMLTAAGQLKVRRIMMSFMGLFG